MNKRVRIPVFVQRVSPCRLINVFTVRNDDTSYWRLSVVVIDVSLVFHLCCFLSADMPG